MNFSRHSNLLRCISISHIARHGAAAIVCLFIYLSIYVSIETTMMESLSTYKENN